ncbi:MAG: T9SS type A sorting domain-containing protein [Bacteroidota bacterium]
MKKILLFTGLFSLVLVGRSQTVLNETYSEPGAGKSEFIELYNSAGGDQNVDCFTILTYWSSGANKGWYVLDLPNHNIVSKGWYVISAASPFNVQSQTGVVPNTNWNAASFRNSSTFGDLRKFQVSGAVYTDVTPADGTAVTDLMVDGDFASSHNYLTLLFKNGIFINGFWGGGPTGTLPATITGMPDLPLTIIADVANGCNGTAFTVDFSALGAVEFVNSSGGSDNGYARTSDGKCGSWVKTSSASTHTPGVTNGSAAGAAGALTTTELLLCNSGAGFSVVNFDITAVSGAATEADDFPVEIQLYYDFAPLGVLTGTDIYQRSEFMATVAAPADTFRVAQIQYTILVYKTKRGCFDRVVSVPNGCAPLPVSFKSFTATRNHSNVMVKWETAWEQNNNGFAVERNINGSWEQIAWVPTQAPNGNSDVSLSYTYTDINNAKGISQYRIRQVDIDATSKYSDVRSVRGENQLGKTIVYPNPSNDGKVNIVFEDAAVTREVAVSDMNGRVVKQIKGITNNNVTIENLLPGMYMIRIVATETGEQVVEKIVVNKR